MNELQIEDTIEPVKEARQEAKAAKDPISFLPKELQGKAQRLPKTEQHTVLTLPEGGAGHNAGLLTVAGICYKMGVSYDETLIHLNNIYDSNRIDFETAPERAVERIWEVSGEIGKLVDSSLITPKENESLINRYKRLPKKELRTISPEHTGTKPIELLKGLFNPKDIICIQKTAMEQGTLCRMEKLEAFLAENNTLLSDYKYLNPAIFKTVRGVEKLRKGEKYLSTRCNENVKRRDYMVLECDAEDIGKAERFNDFAIQMSQFAPLVMAIDSGGKSIHYWFDATDANKTVVDQFFIQACLHGADKRLNVRSQIARMPNVGPSDDKRGPQTLLYKDFEGKKHPDKGWDLPGLETHLTGAKRLNYYYAKGDNYYTQNLAGEWIVMNRASALVDLSKKGYRKTVNKESGEPCTPAESILNEVQHNKSLTGVVKACAGRHSGYYEENGEKFLVLSSPNIIKPVKGSFTCIEKFLKGFLRNDEDQYSHFLSIMQGILIAFLNDGKKTSLFDKQCQMIHLCGPANSGKSLFKDQILTPLLGGRQSKADAFFKRDPDTHNIDIFSAEVMFLDDTPVLSSVYKERQDHGERVKSITVGGGIGGARAMYTDRLTVKSFNKPFRFLNEEPLTLSTLPLLDAGVEDKWVLYRTQDLNIAWPQSNLPGWAEATINNFKKELPAFIYYLLNTHVKLEAHNCPKGRYYVNSYKHKDIIEDIRADSAEQQLMHRIDNDCFNELFTDVFNPEEKAKEWKGTIDSLYDILCTSGSKPLQDSFKRRTPNSNILAARLNVLEKENERVIYSSRSKDYPEKENGLRYWIIKPRIIKQDPEVKEYNPLDEF